MRPNGTAIEQPLTWHLSRHFSTSAIGEAWSDQTRIQSDLDVEEGAVRRPGYLGVIQSEATEEIARHCNVAEIDFEKLKKRSTLVNRAWHPQTSGSYLSREREHA